MESANRKRKTDEETSQSEPPQCSFGDFLNQECHKNLQPSIKSISTLEEHQKSILKMRAGMNSELPIVNICRFHEYKLGEKFESDQTKCCDIFGKHIEKEDSW